MYGYLLATDYACLGLASSILLPCLIHVFHMSDLSLAIIGVVFKIVRLAMMSYGQHSWLVYLSVVVGCPSALIISSSKSVISKLVGDDELGKTFSLLSCGETISNLVGSLLFTSTVRRLTVFLKSLEPQGQEQVQGCSLTHKKKDRNRAFKDKANDGVVSSKEFNASSQIENAMHKYESHKDKYTPPSSEDRSVVVSWSVTLLIS